MKRKRRSDEAPSKSGFVLVEIIVCIGITAVIAVSLVEAYYEAMKTVYLSRMKLEAANIAQTHCESILKMDEDDVLSVYSSYREENGKHEVTVDLEWEDAPKARDLRLEDIECDALIRMSDMESGFCGDQEVSGYNLDIHIDSSGTISANQGAEKIGQLCTGVIVVWREDAEYSPYVNVFNDSDHEITVYCFESECCGKDSMKIRGYNARVQRGIREIDFGLGKTLLKATVRVYREGKMEAEAVTYRNVGGSN